MGWFDFARGTRGTVGSGGGGQETDNAVDSGEDRGTPDIEIKRLVEECDVCEHQKTVSLVTVEYPRSTTRLNVFSICDDCAQKVYHATYPEAQSSAPHPFVYREPTESQVDTLVDLRSWYRELYEELLERVPEGRERSLAITKLEESWAWVSKGVVFDD